MTRCTRFSPQAGAVLILGWMCGAILPQASAADPPAQATKTEPKKAVQTMAAGHKGYRLLAADKGKVAVVDVQGNVEWEAKCQGSAHDVQMLPGGHVLFISTSTKVVELDRAKQQVWSYQAQPTAANTAGKVEIHSVQRLPDGRTMVAESGNRRIVEVDAEGKIVFELPLTVDKPHPHHDTRLARRLENGNYLVCHERDGVVREYNRQGKVVWSYTLDLAGRPKSGGHGPEGHGTDVYGAVRLANGRTLIAAGNGNRVIEVTPEGEVTWSLEQKELPKITLAWVTTLHALPNGNLIVGNCHAGPDNPQLFEVTRDKQVVWQFRDFQTFGNGLAASQVLDLEGDVRR